MARAMRWRGTFALVLVFTVAGFGVSPVQARKALTPTEGYDLDILGFNDGTPYRLEGAEAEAVLVDAGAVLFRFRSHDWMDKDQSGTYESLSEVTARHPNRPRAESVHVYRLDLLRDESPEFLLVPDAAMIGKGRRYAPTLIELGEEGYRPIWSASSLRGERFTVLDIRDLNGDGRPEFLLAGEAGRSGYYRFHEVLGRSDAGIQSFTVKHVDSLHYVDLDRDGAYELVVRQRVGRRGPAYQWTYVDQLHQWDGGTFSSADERFPRYHDQQTLPTLVGDLIDHYEAKLPILLEKVQAIEDVRGRVLAEAPPPAGFARKIVRAIAWLQKGKVKKAQAELERLAEVYPYDLELRLGLARLYAGQGRWVEVLDAAVRALTLKPREVKAWWWAASAFVQLEERSSATACLHHVVRLGKEDEALAFLRARREVPEDPRLEKLVDEVLAGKASP
jgi:hypothetical protein